MAGKRRGLAGERSGLFYEFSRVIDELAPAWFCIENVPGLHSSDPLATFRGGDFGLVLLELTGYPADIPKDGWRNSGVCAGPKRTVAWRMLDSRYFGVAQRRRRVFLVGGPRTSSGFEVLFEPESGNGDSEANEAQGEEVAATVRSRFDSSGRGDETYICHAVKGEGNWKGDGADNFIAGTVSQKWIKGSGGPSGDECQNLVAGTLDTGHGAKRFSNQWIDPRKNFLITGTLTEGRAGTAFASRDSEDKFLVCAPADSDGMREVAGVPGRVDLSVREEQREVCTCADTPRYASLGDAMTVNVMEWIGRRIMAVMDQC